MLTFFLTLTLILSKEACLTLLANDLHLKDCCIYVHFVNILKSKNRVIHHTSGGKCQGACKTFPPATRWISKHKLKLPNHSIYPFVQSGLDRYVLTLGITLEIIANSQLESQLES